ncbi:hypothetical protein K435DRAFT_689468, partial [Dendrothele bispora CBS 962.96]
FTRKTNAFLPARVDRVMEEINIGDDLTADERRVEELLRSYANCFEIAVSEAHAVNGAVQHTQRRAVSKVCTLTTIERTPDKSFSDKRLTKCWERGSENKCVSPITLAQKAHEVV